MDKGNVSIGIDPGQSGGIAVIYPDKSEAVKMPKTEADTFDFLHNVMEDVEKNNYSVFCVIEKVHSMPGQGVASSFKFGKNYGFLRGCLIGLMIPFDEHSPQKWMRHYSMKKNKNESKTDWKNRLKGKAQQLFPEKNITLATSDALLIANYVKQIAW